MAVILLWFVGLLLWSPSSGRQRGGSSSARFASAIAGGIFVAAALVLLYLCFPRMTQNEFSFFAIATFLAALAAEFLIGDDLRRLLRRR